MTLRQALEKLRSDGGHGKEIQQGLCNVRNKECPRCK